MVKKQEEGSSFIKKALTIGAVALVSIGVGVGGVYLLDNPEPITKTITNTITLQGETIYEDVIVEVPYNVTVIEYVDNGDLEFTLERLEDQGIIADADEIVAELKAEDLALELAVAEISNGDLFEMMEDAGLLVDDDEAFIKRIKGDYDEVVVVNANFDDNEYSFDIDVKVYDEDTEDYVYSTVFVEVIEGEAELISVV